MTQKFYLRNSATNTFPTSGEKSTTEPVAASTWGLTPTDKDLLAAQGTSATSLASTTNAVGTPQNGCLGRWSSVGLTAGTYGAGTWTLAVQSQESNTAANAFHCQASIYFWRPSTNAVVGFVVDSDSSVGVELGNNSANVYGQVLSITGSNVTIQNSDILVVELWIQQTQANATARTLTVWYDGTTDVTAAYAGADPASYLQAPADIPVYVATPATGNTALPIVYEGLGLLGPTPSGRIQARPFQQGDDTKPADAGPPPTTGRPPPEAPGLRGPHPQTGRNRPYFQPGDATKPADQGPAPTLPPGMRAPSRQRLQPQLFQPGDDTKAAAKQPPPIIPPARRTPWGRWQPNPLLQQTAPDQFGKAISDYATGSWTVAPLWSKVDEIVPDDTDLITSETLGIAGNTSVADLQLYDMGDPLSSVNHTIWVRAKAAFTLGTSGGLRVELREGNALVNTLIATLTTDALTTSLATYSYTLSSAEADSISSYGDLFLRIYGNFPVGNLGGVSVSWVQFQVPYALVVDAIAPAGAATGTGSAPTPTIAIQPNAGNAAGTGTAPDPTAKVQPSAGASTGTGTAYNPSGALAPNADVATGTGSAPSPASSVGPSAGVATGTGAAYTPVSAVSGTSGVATGTGAANTPAPRLSLNAGIATGTGTAYNPTVITVDGAPLSVDCARLTEGGAYRLVEDGGARLLEGCPPSGSAPGGSWFTGQRGPGRLTTIELRDREEEELLVLV